MPRVLPDLEQSSPRVADPTEGVTHFIFTTMPFSNRVICQPYHVCHPWYLPTVTFVILSPLAPQAFLQLKLPDLEQSSPRAAGPTQGEKPCRLFAPVYSTLFFNQVIVSTMPFSPMVFFQQAFLQLVLPDLEGSSPRVADPVKEEKVRQAAEKAIKEIRLYGFEVSGNSF